MFKVDSNVFISRNDFFIGDQPISEISEEIGKGETYYVLSYHNGFKQYDYTEIEELNMREKTTNMVELEMENNQGERYKLTVENNQKIYTQCRGYVDAERISFLDVFTDCKDLKCKLVNKKHLGLVLAPVFEMKVKYNKSAFINGILCKTL